MSLRLGGDGAITGCSSLSEPALTLSGLTVSGQFFTISGTAAAPGVTFVDDNNTGIYSPAANEVAITTNGTERLRIDDSGDVGIGTTSPAGNLDVLSTSGRFLVRSDQSDLCLDSVNTANNAFDDLRLRASAIRFQNGGTQRMVIDSAGRVGIGAPTPSSYDSTADNLVVGESGDIGITIASSNSSRGTLMFADGQSGLSQYAGYIQYNHNGDYLAIATNNSEAMRINSNGNIGIGTTSPECRLHIRADGDELKSLLNFHNRSTGSNAGSQISFINGGVDASDNRLAYIRSFKSGSNGNFLTFGTNADGTAPAERMRINANGNVGVGTTNPQYQLDVNGTIFANNASAQILAHPSDSAAAPGFTWGGQTTGMFLPANGNLGFSTVGTERVRISSSGNVGIGTSAPQYPLDISGNVRFGSNTGYALIQYGLDSTATDNWHAGSEGDGSFRFYNGNLGSGTEIMRLSGGAILMRRTSNPDSATLCVDQDAPAGNVGISTVTTSTATRFHLLFRNGNGQVGGISTNGSTTTFSTSSDYRLKENVVELDGAIDRVKQLAPKRFNFIVDADTTVDGFLAHEAQAVVPEAVTGNKDEVDDDGNPMMQGIDQSKLVPLLTAALKEAITKIEALESQVASLQASA